MYSQFTRYSSLAVGVAALALALALLLAGCGDSNDAPAPADSSTSIEVIPPVNQSENVSSAPSVSSAPAESTPPASQSESKSVAASQPAQQPQPWWQVIFTCQDTLHGVRGISLHDNATKLSYDKAASDNVLWDALSHGVQISQEELGPAVNPERYLEVVMDSDDKYTIRAYEKGLELTHSHWKLKEKTTVYLGMDAGGNVNSRYDAVIDAIAAIPQEGPYPIPLWIGMMNRGRITEIAAIAPDRTTTTYTDSILLYENADPILRAHTVVKPGVKVVEKTATLDDAYKIKITFENDVRYNISVGKTQLLIFSTDVEQGLLYTLADPDNTRKYMQQLAAGEITPNTPNYNHTFMPVDVNQANPDTGKPVIYLYPEKPTDCTVRVDYPAFTYTYPAYNDGWQVTAYPDGRLVNKADGSEPRLLPVVHAGDNAVFQQPAGFAFADVAYLI